MLHGHDAAHVFVGCNALDPEEPRIECGLCQQNGRHTLLSFWQRDRDQVMSDGGAGR
ncbi:MAG TPA: hypothetical protein VHB97_09305 [Polyangia bacterium]|nr:hypothetical protein [Polyangia bacterium]